MDVEQKLRWENAKPLIEPFVRPIYLALLHANFTRLLPHNSENRDSEITAIARSISDTQIATLLASPGWRERLVAGWCVGLSRRAGFVDQIAELLLASVQSYAGQGYCVALGLIGNESSRTCLENYLRKYLPLEGRIYDQLWAIGALAYIDRSLAQQFLAPELREDRQNFDPFTGI
jgi:hypothetical protein